MRRKECNAPRTEPQHRIAIICATIAYPALENFVQKSMIFISELTKRTYRSKRITTLNISQNFHSEWQRGLSDDEEEEGTTTMRKNENERYERSNIIGLFPSLITAFFKYD